MFCDYLVLIKTMDTHSISIGSGKIDPAAGSVLLVVSWRMTV